MRYEGVSYKYQVLGMILIVQRMIFSVNVVDRFPNRIPVLVDASQTSFSKTSDLYSILTKFEQVIIDTR